MIYQNYLRVGLWLHILFVEDEENEIFLVDFQKKAVDSILVERERKREEEKKGETRRQEEEEEERRDEEAERRMIEEPIPESEDPEEKW